MPPKLTKKSDEFFIQKENGKYEKLGNRGLPEIAEECTKSVDELTKGFYMVCVTIKGTAEQLRKFKKEMESIGLITRKAKRDILRRNTAARRRKRKLVKRNDEKSSEE